MNDNVTKQEYTIAMVDGQTRKFQVTVRPTLVSGDVVTVRERLPDRRVFKTRRMASYSTAGIIAELRELPGQPWACVPIAAVMDRAVRRALREECDKARPGRANHSRILPRLDINAQVDWI